MNPRSSKLVTLLLLIGIFAFAMELENKALCQLKSAYKKLANKELIKTATNTINPYAHQVRLQDILTKTDKDSTLFN